MDRVEDISILHNQHQHVQEQCTTQIKQHAQRLYDRVESNVNSSFHRDLYILCQYIAMQLVSDKRISIRKYLKEHNSEYLTVQNFNEIYMKVLDQLEFDLYE